MLKTFLLSNATLFVIFFFVILMFKNLYYKNLFIFFMNNSIKNYREKLQYYKNQLIKYELNKTKYYRICLITHYCFSIFYIGFFSWCLYYLHDFIKNRNIPGVEIIFTIILSLEILLSIISILPRNKVICKDAFDLNLVSIKETNTCLLIPFGGAELVSKLKTLSKVIEASKTNFNYKDIYLIHNGRTDKPQREIEIFCRRNKINYCYVPVPSKSYAIYYASKNLLKNYTYTMLIDADVLIGENLQMSMIDNVDIFAYMISAEKPEYNEPYLNKLLIFSQDIEYRFAGFNKYLQSRLSKTSTTISHHGAASLYKTSVLKIIMDDHDGIFDGEDYMMGLIAYFKGYCMKTIPKNYVIPTETPNNLSILYSQRVNSWDYVILKFIPHQLYLIFSCNISLPIKINAFFYLWTIFQDFTRIITITFIILYEDNKLQFLLIIIGMLVIKSLLILFLTKCKIKYASFQTTLKDDILILLYFPFYTILTFIFRLLGQIKYLLIFNKRLQHNILLKDRPQLPNVLDHDQLENIDWQTIYTNESI